MLIMNSVAKNSNDLSCIDGKWILWERIMNRVIEEWYVYEVYEREIYYTKRESKTR